MLFIYSFDIIILVSTAYRKMSVVELHQNPALQPLIKWTIFLMVEKERIYSKVKSQENIIIETKDLTEKGNHSKAISFARKNAPQGFQSSAPRTGGKISNNGKTTSPES